MTNKTCKSCLNSFPATTDFFYSYYSKSANKEYLRTNCKKCHSSLMTSSLKELRRQRPLEIRAKEQKARQKISDWVDSLKSGPCTDCGTHYPPVCMDFDHLPEFKKTADVSTARSRKWSKSRILEEVAKCELVCSNCHRIRGQKRAEAFANSVREEVELFEELRNEILSARIFFSEEGQDG
jgi:hypothetical protein